MGKAKTNDNRSDCIYRVKSVGGGYLCSTDGYNISDECLKRFGTDSLKGYTAAKTQKDFRGSRVLDNPSVSCRGCKYYTNNFQDYINRCRQLGLIK